MITDKAFSTHCQQLDSYIPPDCSFFLLIYEVVPLHEKGEPGFRIDVKVAGTEIENDDIKRALAVTLRELAADLFADVQASGGPASGRNQSPR
jgi:hypothetical protein